MEDLSNVRKYSEIDELLADEEVEIGRYLPADTSAQTREYGIPRSRENIPSLRKPISISIEGCE